MSLAGSIHDAGQTSNRAPSWTAAGNRVLSLPVSVSKLIAWAQLATQEDTVRAAPPVKVRKPNAYLRCNNH